MKSYPKFLTCALSDSKEDFIVIDNLEEYLKDGKSGLSEKTLPFKDCGFIHIKDNLWKSKINNSRFF